MKKILIVEDEPWQADVFLRQLTSYSTRKASNGYEAIQLIDDDIPDVIVLDLLLSGSTAMTLLHELTSHDDLAHIPIILVTNLADALPTTIKKHYGIKDVLDKTTLAYGDVMRAVEKVLA